MPDPDDLPAPIASLRRAGRVAHMVLAEAFGDKVHVRSGFLALWCIEAIIPLLLLGAVAAEPLGYDGAIVRAAETLLSGDSIFAETAGPLTDYLTDLLQRADLATLGVPGILSALFIAWQLFVATLYDLHDLQWRSFHLGGFGQIPRFFGFCVWVAALVGGGLAASMSLLQSGQWFLLAAPVLGSTVLLAVAIKITAGHDRTVGGALVGGLVGALWWEVLKSALHLYASSGFGADTLSATYQALGFLPLFFLWMHLTWFSVLLAAVVARIHDNFEPTWDAWRRRRRGDRRRVYPSASLATAAVAFLDDSDTPVLLSEVAAGLSVHPRVASRLLDDLGGLDFVRTCGTNRYALGDRDDPVGEAWEACFDPVPPDDDAAGTEAA